MKIPVKFTLNPIINSLYIIIHYSAVETVLLNIRINLDCTIQDLTEHHATKAYWGSGGIDPCNLELGTRWR
jgi:hypothetical protein